MKRYKNTIRKLLTRTQLLRAFQRAINDRRRLTSMGQNNTPDIEEYRDTAIVVFLVGTIITVAIVARSASHRS
jgi:hypothetical protein